MAYAPQEILDTLKAAYTENFFWENISDTLKKRVVDKSTMIGVLEDVFRHALQKQYETDENFDVIINPEKGDLEIWRNRTVVEDDAVEDPNAQISVSEVKAIDPTYEIGDEYADEIINSDFLNSPN